MPPQHKPEDHIIGRPIQIPGRQNHYIIRIRGDEKTDNKNIYAIAYLGANTANHREIKFRFFYEAPHLHAGIRAGDAITPNSNHHNNAFAKFEPFAKQHFGNYVFIHSEDIKNTDFNAQSLIIGHEESESCNQNSSHDSESGISSTQTSHVRQSSQPSKIAKPSLFVFAVSVCMALACGVASAMINGQKTSQGLAFASACAGVVAMISIFAFSVEKLTAKSCLNDATAEFVVDSQSERCLINIIGGAFVATGSKC